MMIRKLMLRSVVIASLCCMLTLTMVSAEYFGVGTVSASSLRLRSEASTSAGILETVSENSRVVVLSPASNGWYQVNFDGLVGYMSQDYLTVDTDSEDGLGDGYITTGTTALNVRSGPGTSSAKIGTVSGSSTVALLDYEDGWYRIDYNGQTGYISGEYVSLNGGTSSAPTPSADATELAAQIVAYAKTFLGTPYVYGGNGPSQFDCSGFTKYIYNAFGYTINRTAGQQLNNGISVSKSELMPGDLVFFKYNTTNLVSHVGIYIGDGQFIHASTNGYQVRIDTLTSGHYSNVYVYGRRII